MNFTSAYNMSNISLIKIENISISIDFIIFNVITAISTILNLIGIIAILRVHDNLYPIEVTSLIILWASGIIGNILWLIDVCLRSIRQFNLTSQLAFVCYITNARQIFWVSRSHSFAIISINRVVILINNLIVCKITAKKNSSSSFQKYKYQILFHVVHIIIICCAFIPSYFIPDMFKITNYKKCSRFWNDTYKLIFTVARNFVSPTITFINYLIITPIIVIIYFSRNRNNAMAKKRFKPTIILTIKLFFYSLFDLVSMITFFLTLYLSKYKITNSIKDEEPIYKYLIDIVLGLAIEVDFIHWISFRMFMWIYQICYSFHVVVFMLLHTVIRQSIKEMFGYKNENRQKSYTTKSVTVDK
jgi:hypothetical protein